MEMIRQDHHSIQTKWTPFRDVPKRPAQRIDLIDQQTVTPPLGEIDREKPRCAWNMSTAIFRHEIRLTFERLLTRTMRFVPQHILRGLTVRFDADIVNWFRKQERGYAV